MWFQDRSDFLFFFSKLCLKFAWFVIFRLPYSHSQYWTPFLWLNPPFVKLRVKSAMTWVATCCVQLVLYVKIQTKLNILFHRLWYSKHDGMLWNDLREVWPITVGHQVFVEFCSSLFSRLQFNHVRGLLYTFVLQTNSWTGASNYQEAWFKIEVWTWHSLYCLLEQIGDPVFTQEHSCLVWGSSWQMGQNVDFVFRNPVAWNLKSYCSMPMVSCLCNQES